jgi:hypothetical protein
VLPGKGHSVFTGQYDDTPGSPTANAMGEVISYLRTQLHA